MFDRLCVVVDGSRSKTGDDFLISLTDRRPYRPAERARQLHRNMSDPARAALDQYGLASLQVRAIHDSRIRSDEGER